MATQQTLYERLLHACQATVIAYESSDDEFDTNLLHAWNCCKLAIELATEVEQQTIGRNEFPYIVRLEVVRRFCAGETQKELAADYNTTQQYISKIIKRMTK
jgi:hypothetical protein